MTKTISLQIFQTSDLHGYVYPFRYTSRKEQAMGLAKLQTKLLQLSRPNRLLIDTGDTIQGSPLTYYVAKQNHLKIHPMAQVLNHMNYDYITIGNHEFNYGLRVLHSFVDHLTPTILNGNLLDQRTNQPFVGVTHDIRTLADGPTIGIIGVTTHYIPNWEQPSHIANLAIRDAFETAQELVKQLRPKVDYLIVNYHGGFEKDLHTMEYNVENTGENQGAKLLEELPDIDLLLTGHQHRLLQGTHQHTTYVQPGFNGRNLAEIQVTFTHTTAWSHETKVTLHDVSDVEADPAILALLSENENNTQDYLDTPVGQLDKDYFITDQLAARVQKHPLVSLINHIQQNATKADISMCSLGNAVSGFAKDITIRDIIGTYEFPNTLVVKELTGRIIKQALEKSAEFFAVAAGEIVIAAAYNHPKLQLYAYDMYDPITYTIHVSNPIGDRIHDLLLHGEPLDMDKTYTVVMNNYRASGGGDYSFIPRCPTVSDTQIEVIELLVDYIVSNKQITIPHTNNIKVIL